MTIELGEATIKFHSILLSDLDQREAKVSEDEASARKAYEQAMSACKARRETIGHERKTLEHSIVLFRRFMESEVLQVSASCILTPVPRSPQPIAAPETDAPSDAVSGDAEVPVMDLAEFAMPPPGSRIKARISDLRERLIDGRISPAG